MIVFEIAEMARFLSYISSYLADLVTFTEEVLNRKLHFLCSASNKGRFLR